MKHKWMKECHILVPPESFSGNRAKEYSPADKVLFEHGYRRCKENEWSYRYTREWIVAISTKTNEELRSKETIEFYGRKCKEGHKVTVSFSHDGDDGKVTMEELELAYIKAKEMGWTNEQR